MCSVLNCSMNRSSIIIVFVYRRLARVYSAIVPLSVKPRATGCVCGPGKVTVCRLFLWKSNKMCQRIMLVVRYIREEMILALLSWTRNE